MRPRELERAAAAIAAPRGGAGRSPSASSSASSHDASPVRPPRFGAWTLDARCRVHRFAPFAHGDAPDHLHPATRAVAAVAARGAIDHDRPRARAMAVPVAAIVAALAAGSLAAMLFSSGALSTGNRELLTLAGLLAAVPVARLLRAHVAFRHRGFAVAVPLLVLGRCGACGHPLHGSPALAPVPADGDEGPRCACAECGAIWPHQAAGAPRDDDGRTRTDFPTVTGVDAWRLRRILSRAMRADASDFRRDERSRLFHIASFGVDSHGAAAAAWSESARALRFVAVAFVALFLAGCPIAVIASLVSGIALGPAGVASPSDAFLAVAPVVLCGAIILLAIVDAVDRGLRGLVASELVARRLRAGRCPVCTKELDAGGGAHALSECGCCGAAWR